MDEENTSGYDLNEETPDHSSKPESYVIVFTKQADFVKDASLCVLRDVFQVSYAEAKEAVSKLNVGDTTIALVSSFEVVQTKEQQLQKRLEEDLKKGFSHELQFAWYPQSRLQKT